MGETKVEVRCDACCGYGKLPQGNPASWEDEEGVIVIQGIRYVREGRAPEGARRVTLRHSSRCGGLHVHHSGDLLNEGEYDLVPTTEQP